MSETKITRKKCSIRCISKEIQLYLEIVKKSKFFKPLGTI